MEYIIIPICLTIVVFFLLRPKAGFVIFIFLASFDHFIYWNDLGFKVKIYQVFLFAGLLTFLLLNLLGKARIQKDRFFPFLILYWGLGLISLNWAVNKTDAYIILIIELISILVYFLVTQMVRNVELIRKTLLAFLHSGNFVALYSIFQVIGFSLGLKTHVIQTDVYSWGRPTGTFFESNYLGTFSLSIALIMLGLLTSKVQVVNRNYLRAGLLLQLIALILSMTRGAWIGLFLGVWLLIWLLLRTETKWGMPLLKTISFLLLAALITIVFVYSISSSIAKDVLNRITSLKSLNFNVDSQSTESVRFARMQRVSQIIKNRFWLGYGPGQAGLYSEVFSWFSLEKDYLRRGAGASNLFLGIIFQRGVLGLAVMGAFLVIILFRTARTMPKIEDGALRTVTRSVFLGFCGILMTFMFTENHLLAFFWVQMGFIVAVQKYALSRQQISGAGEAC